MDVRGRQSFDAQPVLLRTADHSANDRALRWADLQQAYLPQKALARDNFQLAPQLVGPQQQRHVVGVLEIRLPDDPRLAVRAAPVVAPCKPVDPQHPRPPPRQVIRGRAPHAARAEDDDIVSSHVHRLT